MGKEFDMVVAALPRLSGDERDRLVARIRAMSSVAPADAAADPAQPSVFVSEPVRDVLEIIAREVLRYSGEVVHPAALTRAAQFKPFVPKARELADYADKYARSRAQRLALIATGVELLRRDLAEAGMTVTARTLMACIHQVPGVIVKAFPGYAESGLVGMIVRPQEEKAHE